MITIEDIRAAAANDLTAYAKVNAELESRITAVAANAARKLPSGRDLSASHREEFAQVARIAAWEALTAFDGSTVDHFFGFVTNTMTGRVRDAIHTERVRGAAGVKVAALAHFAKAVFENDGDVHAAERQVQEQPYKGSCLSANYAHAVRSAWSEPSSLDFPLNGGDYTIADTMGTDEEPAYDVNRRSRPDLWQRAARALDDYLPAPKDAHLREAVCEAIGNAFRGVILLSDVELLEDLPTPKNDTARRQVTDAVNILRGLIEQQDVEDVLPEEMQTSQERSYAAQRETTRKVHDVLNSMGKVQREALVGAFGINLSTTPIPSFWLGHGDEYDKAGLAAALNTTPRKAEVSKYEGLKKFRLRWEAAEAGKPMRNAVGAAVAKAGA